MNTDESNQMNNADNLFDHVGNTHTVTGGVQRSSATLDNGMVNIDGLEVPREVAQQMGLLGSEPTNGVRYETSFTAHDHTNHLEDAHEASEKPTEESTEQPAVAEESTEDFVERIVSEEAQPILDQAFKIDGGAVDAAIGDLLSDGDISEETLNRLQLATNASGEDLNSYLSEIGANLDAQIDEIAGVPAASEMLQVAAMQSPNVVKAAVMSAINGDPAQAADIAADTYSKLDVSQYAEGLVEALEGDGYTTVVKNGRLYLRGNEYADFTAWSTAAPNFNITFHD